MIELGDALDSKYAILDLGVDLRTQLSLSEFLVTLRRPVGLLPNKTRFLLSDFEDLLECLDAVDIYLGCV